MLVLHNSSSFLIYAGEGVKDKPLFPAVEEKPAPDRDLLCMYNPSAQQ
jgi:hypothetical protein